MRTYKTESVNAVDANAFVGDIISAYLILQPFAKMLALSRPCDKWDIEES